MEEDVKLLIKMKHWVSIVPHKKKWKCVIWRLEDEDWKSHKSKVYGDPIKCYEWAAAIMMEVYDKYENTYS